MKTLNHFTKSNLVRALVDDLGYTRDDFKDDTKQTLISWICDNCLRYEVEDYLNA